MGYRILSLSGGGVRGIFQAVCLRELRKTIGSVREHFDLISGTSTGSIVALGLALDIEMHRVVNLFRIHGPRIFRRRALQLLRKGPRYPDRVLKEILREVFGDLKLKDCKTRVLVPATAINRFQIRAFTDLGPRDPDGVLSVVDVIMASCAAPTVFPPVQPLGEERHYVDGGVWGNSPSLVAAMAAVSYAQQSWADLRVVTIGNGTFPAGMRGSSLNFEPSARP
jgi:patatin-like phospholipase/acyl hydrolase